jgi:hypothetical protein
MTEGRMLLNAEYIICKIGFKFHLGNFSYCIITYKLFFVFSKKFLEYSSINIKNLNYNLVLYNKLISSYWISIIEA